MTEESLIARLSAAEAGAALARAFHAGYVSREDLQTFVGVMARIERAVAIGLILADPSPTAH